VRIIHVAKKPIVGFARGFPKQIAKLLTVSAFRVRDRALEFKVRKIGERGAQPNRRKGFRRGMYRSNGQESRPVCLMLLRQPETKGSNKLSNKRVR